MHRIKKCEGEENDQRQLPNPFHLAYTKKIKRSESIQQKRIGAKGFRKKIAQQKLCNMQAPIAIVDSTSDSDDVILIRAPSPPFYSLVSSDEENVTAEPNKNINAMPFASIDSERRHDNTFDAIEADSIEIVSSMDAAMCGLAPIEPIHDVGKPQLTYAKGKRRAAKHGNKKSTKETCNPNALALNNKHRMLMPKRLSQIVEQEPYEVPATIADSTGDSDDDVIVIPVPSCPVHSLDSSDEENMISESNEENQNLHNDMSSNENYCKQRPFGGIDAADLIVPASIADSTGDNDDDVIFIRPPSPTIYNVDSSDEENITAEPNEDAISNNDGEQCQNDGSLIDAAIVSSADASLGSNVPIAPMDDDVSKLQQTNRHSVIIKREIAEPDVATNNPCKVESLDWRDARPEEFYISKSPLESVRSEIEITNHLKRKSVESNHGSAYETISPDSFACNEPDQNCEEKENDESNVDDKDDANCVPSKPLVIHPEMGWNSEMKAFYNDSWGGETHDSKILRNQMPIGFMEWPIIEADLYANHNLLKGAKCMNCQENGHKMKFCPHPRKPIVCYTCGYYGHREGKCPNAICLKCGEKTISYSRGCNRCFRLFNVHCTTCRALGHVQSECPDNWRSYHNIIDHESTPRPLQSNIRRTRYCSICAGAGHAAEYCYNAMRLIGEKVPSSKVSKYQNVYNTNLAPVDNSKTDPYVMFESPRENFEFNWNVNESKDRIYGRFMMATKIERKLMTETDKTKRGGRRVKKRRLNDDLVVEKNKKKLVVNPFSTKNKSNSEKPIKPFCDGFPTEWKPNCFSHNIPMTINSAEGNRIDENVCAEESEAGWNVDQHISLEENIDNKRTDMSVPDFRKDDFEGKIQANNDEVDMYETMDTNERGAPTDTLRGLTNFSSATEMEKLENTKTSNVQVAQSISENKVSQNEAEIQKLTEVEMTLNYLKKRLTTMNKSKDNSNEHSVLRKHIPLSPTKIESHNTTDNQRIEAGISQRFVGSLLTNCVTKAKLFLTKEENQMLMTQAGNYFLHQSLAKNRVKIHKEWDDSNILVIVGTELGQKQFQKDLVKYFHRSKQNVTLIKTERSDNLEKESLAISTNENLADDIKSENNSIWSLKCKEIVEKYRQLRHSNSSILDKLYAGMVKATKNELSHSDYISLDKIAKSLMLLRSANKLVKR